MMRGWVSPKTIKYTAQQQAIADGYRNGTSVNALCEKYRLSRTWVYQVIYCYGLAPRTRLTEQRDPLNYYRLKRHLKRREKSNHKPEDHRSVPGPQISELRLDKKVQPPAA